MQEIRYLVYVRLPCLVYPYYWSMLFLLNKSQGNFNLIDRDIFIPGLVSFKDEISRYPLKNLSECEHKQYCQYIKADMSPLRKT